MQCENLLLFRIKSLHNQIKRLLERSAIEKNEANLTGMQYGILGFLGKHQDRENYQRDIEAEFNIRRSTATGMLQLLEKEGYIHRENVLGDARLKKIVLTHKAMELGKIIETRTFELQEKLTRNISQTELEQFYLTLDKILNNAKE